MEVGEVEHAGPAVVMHPHGVTRQLAEMMATTTLADVPTSAVESVHRATVDWIGCVVAGAVEPPARMCQRLVAGFGDSREATVLGAGRASAAGAALANGVAAHMLELDDIHKGSTVHAAAPVISAALAAAERAHADGERFALAVTLGYEAALRIGEAVNPSHYRYWHPTGTVATFGAAAAVGTILGLSSDAMSHALGSAGTQAAGLWEFNADGAMSKHLHPGKAAFNGVLAADLARWGFTGASRVLEGSRGFFEAMSDSYDATRITDGLGARWKLTENGYKLHACCAHTHTAIDVALELRADARYPRDDAAGHIAAIDIETYGPGFAIVNEMRPRTPYQAKFSLAYVVAVALLEGQVTLDQFVPSRFGPEGVRADVVRSLLERTRIVVRDDLTARYPHAWPARVAISLDNGIVLRGASDYPRGHPENAVPTSVLETKMLGLVESRFGTAVAHRLLEAVRGIPACGDMALAIRDIVPVDGASA
jgi:2-methylcitrate dehydratase PrpD